jgi:hypothetical protein
VGVKLVLLLDIKEVKKKYLFITGFIAGIIIAAIYFYDIIYLISGKDMRFRAVPIHTAYFVDVSNWDAVQKYATDFGIDAAASRLNAFLKAQETENILHQLREQDNLLLQDLHTNRFILSYHITKPGYTESLLILELDQARTSTLEDMLKEQTKFPVEKRMVRGDAVWDISIGSAYNRWTLTTTHNLLLVSKDPALVEDGLLQIKDNISIFSDATFKQLSNTTQVYINLYFHCSNMSSTAQAFADKSAFQITQPISRFADWMALNLQINKNGLSIDGFCTSNEKELRFLNDYNFINKVKFYPLAQKPDNTALLYTTILRLNDSKENLKSNPVLKHPDFKQYVEPWFDEEASIVMTEPVGANYEAYSLLFLKSKLNSRPIENLRPLLLSSDDANNRFPISYKGYVISKLNTAGWYGMLLPNPFTELISPYILFTKDYVILANSLTQLKLYVERLNDKKTLDKTIVPGMNMSSFTTGNYVLYSSLPLLNDMFENSVNKEFAASFLEEYNLMAKWSPMLLEFNFESKGVFKVSGMMVTQQARSDRNNSAYLWKTELDTIAITAPHVVMDARGREKRIMVQDANNNLYMLNRAGDIVWRRNLNAPVKGPIVNIDFYKNSDNQIVLATENKLYVIDENGKDLPNFPVTLPFKAITDLSVVDPEGSRNYLYLIGCENGYFYGYEKSGRPLSGWNPNPDGRNVTLPVSYFRYKSKEFFMLITDNGDLRFYSRYGKEVYKELKTNTALTRSFVAAPGKGFVVSNTMGDTYFLGYDGKVNKTNAPVNECMDAMYAHFTSKTIPDLICLTSKNMIVYRYDSTFLFRYDFNSLLTEAELSMVQGPGIKPCVLVNDHDLIIPVNAEGKAAKHFPKKGMGSFSGADLYNNGDGVLIGMMDEKTVVAYPLEW